MKARKKRMGRKWAERPDWKKAYVTLAPGQNVEFFEGGISARLALNGPGAELR
jgi:ribosomal protein L23